MLKKTITYEDFNGDSTTEVHHFHLSKADLIELELSYEGGLEKNLKRMIEKEDGGEIIRSFKKIVLMAYGKRSEDGKRFIKNDELRAEFKASEAYSTLFVDLVTNPDAASDFINGITPNDPGTAVEAPKGVTDTPKPAFIPKALTRAEMIDLDRDELTSGLQTGRYTIAEE